MHNTVIMNGKEFMVQSENSDYYHLIDYAPDGEVTKLIVSKLDCVFREGEIYVEKFKIDAHY